ncbi:MAG: DUF1592 domain-containing protein [Bryobacterales bacterium]|nr:DUF1592 domain-containing protein [Bryobacterales bacterium]
MIKTLVTVFSLASGVLLAASPAKSEAPALFKQYCFTCHGKAATAGINLDKLTAAGSVGEQFQQWLKIAHVLETRTMPPPKMPQPEESRRREAAAWIRARLADYANAHSGDPGRVTARRLTSGEYAYTILDLTGLDLRTELNFAGDSAGGEGFTNFGDVQFMQEADLERHLEAAKLVANHAVIGAGPISFYSDPGKMGKELSAIHRIQEIYRQNGFRAASAEGGRPYGMERYANAFYAAWRFRHRVALGEPRLTLEAAAAAEGLSARFIQHIWSVLDHPHPAYPTSVVVEAWRKLPEPEGGLTPAFEKTVRAGCNGARKSLLEWTRWLFAAGALAAGGQGDERALVLTEASLKATPGFKFRTFFRGRTKGAENGHARIYLSALSANPDAKDKPLLVWKNAKVRFLKADRSGGPSTSLASHLDDASREKLKLGQAPGGLVIGPEDFVTSGESTIFFDVKTPPEATGAAVELEAELPPGLAGDTVLRVTVADRADLSSGRPPAMAIMANPDSAGYRQWKHNVLAFAANLPQTSHGEPTPADRDPIPEPWNNDYNQPERDRFHTQLKYYRNDGFLVEKMLDDAARVRLEDAWSDLYASFDYHALFLDFLAGKFQFDPKIGKLGAFTASEIAALPAAARAYVTALNSEYAAVLQRQRAAQARHLGDCLQFAARAWRRPLTAGEQAGLRGFYTKLRQTSGLDHEKATRALIARILVAPAFLYRFEQVSQSSAVQPLTAYELASRLSYFLWSSAPDAELLRAASAGELSQPAQLDRQVRRMLTGEKGRRFATEFFGQWLGFYRFDAYRGVDTSRFPEFTDEVKEAMYGEAISFFEHIVRQERPLKDLITADYTFLNASLAKHYGMPADLKLGGEPSLVPRANQYHRGGMLRLGAVLTATSAPLRTSPVKRGDWMLRRVLGLPTPPPPANAGSLPGDDKQFGGMTVKQRLESHKQKAACASCHYRIDPLGFPLEKYDPVGRWRETYPDGKTIEDFAATLDQTEITGIDGLIEYLRNNGDQVRRNMAQKLTGYALGRTILASDLPLIDAMVRLGPEATMVQFASSIAASPQFRNRRGAAVSSVPPRKAAAKTARATARPAAPATGSLRPNSTRGDR